MKQAFHDQAKLKIGLAALLAFFSLSQIICAHADEMSEGWVVDKSYHIDADRVWRSSILYQNERKIKPSVCALDYKISLPNQPVAHPVVFLVSRMSKEFWTTDKAWHLNANATGQATLKIDQKKHVFALDPETEHIFMTLVTGKKIETILTDLAQGKRAELNLAARGERKTVPLPMASLEPVLVSFRKCISSPVFASAAKVPVKNDRKLPQQFRE